MGGFYTDTMFGQVYVGTVSQVAYDAADSCRDFPTRWASVITLAVLDRRTDLYLRDPPRGAM